MIFRLICIRIDSSVFVNLKLLEQRAKPAAVSSTDVPMFCNNIDLNDLEKMDQMTQRVRKQSIRFSFVVIHLYQFDFIDVGHRQYRWFTTCQ